MNTLMHICNKDCVESFTVTCRTVRVHNIIWKNTTIFFIFIAFYIHFHGIVINILHFYIYVGIGRRQEE